MICGWLGRTADHSVVKSETMNATASAPARGRAKICASFTPTILPRSLRQLRRRVPSYLRFSEMIGG